jgi:hypothetical protein
MRPAEPSRGKIEREGDPDAGPPGRREAARCVSSFFPLFALSNQGFPMSMRIQSITWQRPDDDAPTDVTDAIAEGVVSPTPHPDDDIDHPKGYALKLTLKPDETDFAEDIQQALMDVEPSIVTVRLDGADGILKLPVSVSKVPYPGEQNTAEMGVKPEAHEELHPYF